jgi:hypothetical protein
MFIVMLVGGNEAGRFFTELENLHNDVIFLPDDEQFYDNTDLFVCFGGPMSEKIKYPMHLITWSGDDQETLERVFKTLGVK